MGVYIRDMKIPERCYDCTLDYDGWLCRALGRYYSHDTAPYDRRFPDCPLIEVPEHGRLVDADNLMSVVNKATVLPGRFKDIFNALVAGEPTVIPVSEAQNG